MSEWPSRSTGLAAVPAREIDLQVVAILSGFAEFGPPAESCELGSQQRAQAIDGRLVVARRFDLDQLADGLDDLFPATLEIFERDRRG